MLTMSGGSIAASGQLDAQGWAVDLWWHAESVGLLGRLWRRALGRSTHLRTLGDAGQHGQRALGRQTVEIARIVGSEGRAGDFDSAFAPVRRHIRDRWTSVARARHEGRALPPVQLIKAEDGYYVRDGHHRISVARALGEEFVEAEVISWEG
jgi:hypothetical protein